MTGICSKTFKIIHELMPIVCIDVVIRIDGKFLLIKREKEPAKGQFWFPGGRLIKHEKIKDAAARIVKQETNLNIINQVFLDIDETIFDEDPFEHNGKTHTVNLVFAANVRAVDMMALALDEHHSDFKLYNSDFIYDKENNVHPYIKKFLILAEASFNRR